MRRPVAIVEAPSILGLRPSGVETLPDALLAAGLADRPGARRAGRVEASPYDPRRDPAHGMLNADAIAAYAVRLADALDGVLDAGAFPLVLGGDCSVMLGPLLALRRRGRYGLLFLDGHADFYSPAANFNGEAASSELYFATGRGPDVLAAVGGLRPLVRDEDVVALGMRDAAEAASYGSDPLPPTIRGFELREVRRLGAAAAAREALGVVAREELAGFWLHLDADVLDDAVMPFVDYRQPGGLSWGELETVLVAALATGRAAGLELTIYNPRLDRDGNAARGLVVMLARVLGSSGSGTVRD